MHPNDTKRRSSQTAIFHIFETFTRLIGPILPFTADEAWSFHKKNEKLSDEFLALEDWPTEMQEWKEGQEVEDMGKILDFKERYVNESLEALRAAKEIGQSLEAEIKIMSPNGDPISNVLERRKDQLPEIFIVSSVIVEFSGEKLTVSARHAPGFRCPRSWRWVPELVEVEEWGKVSPRCAEVLKELKF